MNLRTSAFVIGVLVALAACSKKEDAAPPGAATPPEQTAPQAFAYVSNLDGPVTIYSLTKHTKTGEIKVGKGGRGIGLTDDGKLLVVAVKEAKELAIIDTTTAQIVRRVPLQGHPALVNALGTLAFVTHEPTNQKDDEASRLVAIVDLIKGEKINEIATDAPISGIEFSADGKHLVVINEVDENLSVYDIETREKTEQISLESYGIRPRSVKRSPDGEQFVVSMEYSNKIVILDSDYNVIDESTTGEVPYGISYNSDGSEIIVALARGKAIQVFDTETLALKREMPVGEHCLHFSLTPDDAQLIAACGRTNNVIVLDYATGNLIKDIPEANTPWGVVVVPSTPGSLSPPPR